MTLKEMFMGGTGALVILLTLVQISPIKINPWGALVKWFGKMLHGDILEKLDGLEKRMEHHIKIDDERDADLHRYRILRFNTEIMRGNRHTEEEFNEILYNVKCYETYCQDHPNYKNNRAVLAIENIERVYKEKIVTGDFL